MFRPVLSAIVVAIAGSGAARADSTSGTIVAYDRKANVIVLEDRTVWSLASLKTPPEGLKAGDAVTIDYTSNGDSGWARINSLKVKG